LFEEAFPMSDPLYPDPQNIGEYEVLNKIAQGGMCPVYRARHPRTGQVVAVKVLPATTAKNPVLLKRFEQEFQAASKLDHPNLVRALDFSSEGSAPFLVMEYIEGESLGDKLEREGRMPEAEAVRIIVQVCQVLHYVHSRGVIHRDIKPDNVLLTLHGQAKLTDLGLVKELVSSLNLTRAGGGLGTPHFMAPEQFRDAKNADHRCDIYGVGATLYMMVTGELPFADSSPVETWKRKVQDDLPSPRTLVPSLSVRTEQIIRRAMAPDRNQRHASCQALEQELTGQRSVPSPAPPAEPRDYLPGSGAHRPLDDTLPLPNLDGQTEVLTAEIRPVAMRPLSVPSAPAFPALAPSSPDSAEALSWLLPVAVALLAGLTAWVFLFHQ
jgi:serine/threonine protein kinase